MPGWADRGGASPRTPGGTPGGRAVASQRGRGRRLPERSRAQPRADILVLAHLEGGGRLRRALRQLRGPGVVDLRPHRLRHLDLVLPLPPLGGLAPLPVEQVQAGRLCGLVVAVEHLVDRRGRAGLDAVGEAGEHVGRDDLGESAGGPGRSHPDVVVLPELGQVLGRCHPGACGHLVHSQEVPPVRALPRPRHVRRPAVQDVAGSLHVWRLGPAERVALVGQVVGARLAPADVVPQEEGVARAVAERCRHLDRAACGSCAGQGYNCEA
mmetsp:Transcript_53283/g.143711  ORF Transcript_53283/g.143711 Transcript_53283/m.143711 type:complete len:268 (+) Transcript_53283:461-1264(+)